MKKIIKVLGIILFSAFLLLPLKTYAQEAEWSQELDLNDSVSSAIAKVEDGVVVMQYEGVASANNLLIKYDFNGKRIWEIDNDYGYNIESVSDGFIVWSEEKITKFDKDKNILWSKDIELKNTTIDNSNTLVGLGNKLIELNDRYIICQTQVGSNKHNDLFSIDFNGNIINRLSAQSFLENNNISYSNWDYLLLAVGKSTTNNSFTIGYRTNYNSPFYISEVSNDFTVIKTLDYDNIRNRVPKGMDIFNGIVKIIPTDKGYITVGINLLYFLENGKIKKYDKQILDMVKVDNSIYAYELRENEENYVNMYNTYIVKYDLELKEQSKIKLPLILNSEINVDANYFTVSGVSQIKSRFILNEVSGIVLNTPVVMSVTSYTSSDQQQDWNFINYADSYEIESDKYTLTSYRLTESNDNKGEYDLLLSKSTD